VRILLTGASGFVGSRLTQLLLKSGANVVNLGRRPCLVAGVENVLVPAFGAAHLSDKLTEIGGIDGVIHLAAAGVNPGDRDHDTIYALNSAFAPKIVSIGAELGAKAVVTVGSSAEYRAQPAARPFDEDMPLETAKIYGASKAAGGILALAEGATIGVSVGHIRLFNVYGPGEAAHRLLPSLARSLSEREAVKLSPGTQVRDFIHVDDACEGLIAAFNALLARQMNSGAYNLATGTGTTVNQFARGVAGAMDADPGLLHFGALAFRPDDLPYVVGDPSKLSNACGWTARKTLADGIASAVAALRLDNNQRPTES
jgi:nucleoside-diphosphate-sugar epimerase